MIGRWQRRMVFGQQHEQRSSQRKQAVQPLSLRSRNPRQRQRNGQLHRLQDCFSQASDLLQNCGFQSLGRQPPLLAAKRAPRFWWARHYLHGVFYLRVAGAMAGLARMCCSGAAQSRRVDQGLRCRDRPALKQAPCVQCFTTSQSTARPPTKPMRRPCAGPESAADTRWSLLACSLGRRAR
jgi:hypothetical protein